MKILVGTRTANGRRQMAVRVFRDGGFRVVKYSDSVYLIGAEAELAARAILAARGVFVARVRRVELRSAGGRKGGR